MQVSFKTKKWISLENKDCKEDLRYIYRKIFNSSPDEHMDFISVQKGLLILICYDGDKPVAFKVGYLCSGEETRFYSWAGGTDAEYRSKGIATALMKKQHEECKLMGIKVIETKCRPTWPQMMSLNAKFGFNVIKEYTSVRGEKKFLLEKILT